MPRASISSADTNRGLDPRWSGSAFATLSPAPDGPSCASDRDRGRMVGDERSEVVRVARQHNGVSLTDRERCDDRVGRCDGRSAS